MTGKNENIPVAEPNPQLDELVKLRRMFHQNPEIKWTEFYTTAKICDIMEELGFSLSYGKELYQAEDHRKLLPREDMIKTAYLEAEDKLNKIERIREMKGGYTGVIARLKCSDTGPKIGFRFDIDALPGEESSSDKHFPEREGFASLNKNMHACGHDGHMAVGLGLAKRISENREQLKGDYYFIFQPGEEGGMGGLIFSKLEIMRKLDYFFALHIGLIRMRKIFCGVKFMASNQYSVEFFGKGIHSAVAPQKGKNALLAACNAALNLHAIPRHGDGDTRVNIGQFHSNNAINVVSDNTKFEFQVRGSTTEIANYMAKESLRMIKAAADLYDVDVKITREGIYISVESSKNLRNIVRNSALEAGIPQGAVLDEVSANGSEDAPFMMEVVRKNGGEAAYIGIGSDTKGGHHNPKFDFDEDLLFWGVEVFWGVVRKLESS